MPTRKGTANRFSYTGPTRQNSHSATAPQRPFPFPILPLPIPSFSLALQLPILSVVYPFLSPCATVLLVLNGKVNPEVRSETSLNHIIIERCEKTTRRECVTHQFHNASLVQHVSLHAYLLVCSESQRTDLHRFSACVARSLCRRSEKTKSGKKRACEAQRGSVDALLGKSINQTADRSITRLAANVAREIVSIPVAEILWTLLSLTNHTATTWQQLTHHTSKFIISSNRHT